jgi:hypothetical protein
MLLAVNTNIWGSLIKITYVLMKKLGLPLTSVVESNLVANDAAEEKIILLI